MTDRLLPHASVVMNRAIAELIMHGEKKLADELAAIHRATCDLTHALARAGLHDATPADLRAAQADVVQAIATLRGSNPA